MMTDGILAQTAKVSSLGSELYDARRALDRALSQESSRWPEWQQEGHAKHLNEAYHLEAGLSATFEAESLVLEGLLRERSDAFEETQKEALMRGILAALPPVEPLDEDGFYVVPF